jgi:hypothetical protein
MQKHVAKDWRSIRDYAWAFLKIGFLQDIAVQSINVVAIHVHCCSSLESEAIRCIGESDVWNITRFVDGVFRGFSVKIWEKSTEK